MMRFLVIVRRRNIRCRSSRAWWLGACASGTKLARSRCDRIVALILSVLIPFRDRLQFERMSQDAIVAISSNRRTSLSNCDTPPEPHGHCPKMVPKSSEATGDRSGHDHSAAFDATILDSDVTVGFVKTASPAGPGS